MLAVISEEENLVEVRKNIVKFLKVIHPGNFAFRMRNNI
jgi:hypothetical protein